MLETTADVMCPYCGENITLFIDLSVSQSYIEDCSVCCQPMTVSYTVSDDGELGDISANADGE